MKGIEVDDERLAALIARQRPGFSLAQPFYTSDETFNYDLDRIIFPFWQFAGHVARVPRAGDYFLLEIAGESVIITRDQEGQIRALANVCRHRGSRVCLQAEGTARQFVCPYHAWVYSNSGLQQLGR